MKEYKSILRIL